MSVESALKHGRKAAESRMTSSCTIERPGNPVFDPATGENTEAGATLVYSGKCRIKGQGPGVRMPDVQGRETVNETYELLVPAQTEGVSVSDRVLIRDHVYAVNSVDDSDQANALSVFIVHQDRGTVQYA